MESLASYQFGRGKYILQINAQISFGIISLFTFKWLFWALQMLFYVSTPIFCSENHYNFKILGVDISYMFLHAQNPSVY